MNKSKKVKENGIIKYNKGELDRIGNSISITNKLLSINNNLIIEKTSTTPYINFNSSTGEFLTKGRSVPINSIEFYSPIIEWLDKQIINSKKDIYFRFHLQYINGDSSTIILSLLSNSIKRCNEREIKCSIDWYYEADNDFILDFGKHLQSALKVPFNLISVDNTAPND